jgi:ankyrin repeat protein
MSGANTDLHIAAAMGDVTKIRILLAEGARPDAENTFGKLPEELTGNAAIKSLLRGALVCILGVRGQH